MQKSTISINHAAFVLLKWSTEFSSKGQGWVDSLEDAGVKLPFVRVVASEQLWKEVIVMLNCCVVKIHHSSLLHFRSSRNMTVHYV